MKLWLLLVKIGYQMFPKIFFGWNHSYAHSGDQTWNLMASIK